MFKMYDVDNSNYLENEVSLHGSCPLKFEVQIVSSFDYILIMAVRVCVCKRDCVCV